MSELYRALRREKTEAIDRAWARQFEAEAFNERAAIREYDGGQTREEAERGAMEDLKR